MFKRVITEDNLTEVIAMISFGISFSVFVFFSIKAIMTNKSHADQAATIPLDEEEK